MIQHYAGSLTTLAGISGMLILVDIGARHGPRGLSADNEAAGAERKSNFYVALRFFRTSSSPLWGYANEMERDKLWKLSSVNDTPINYFKKKYF